MSNQYLTNDQAAFINNLMPGLQVAEVGGKLQNALALGVQLGTKHYLDPVNGNDDNDGLSATTAFKTLPVAYAALTENKNEVLYILGGSSSLSLAAAFTWAKSYTHCIGIGAELRFGGRVRIGHSANFATMVTISGSGCVFHNLHFQCGRGSTTNVTCVSISGLRNQFSNCHFEAMLHATEAGGTQAWRAVSLESAAQANTFKGCTFGSWTTVWASANGKLINFGGDNGDTYVEDSYFIINTSSTSMKAIGFTGAISGGYSYVVFSGCRFISTNATLGVLSETPTNGTILFDSPSGFGFSAYGGASTSIQIAGTAVTNKATGIAVASS